MPGTADTRDLAAVSRFAAGDLLLTQGAGGNASVKTREGFRLLIKASGLRLADVTETGGYLEMDRAALRAIMEDPSLADLDPLAAHDETAHRLRDLASRSSSGLPGLRPSMETGFHLLLERVVLHTHPVYLNAFTCSRHGLAALREVADAPFAWIPYATPGYPLATAVAAGCAKFRAVHGRPPRRIVLESHGLITTSQDAAETIEDTRTFIGYGERYFGNVASEACGETEPSARILRQAERLAGIFSSTNHAAVVRPARRRAVVDAARGPGPASAGPLTPDDAVYGVHEYWRLDGATPVDWAEERADALPAKAVLELAGEGTLLIGPNARALEFMEENLLANVLLHQLIARRARPRHLAARFVDEILALESEQYRQALAGRPAAGGERCRS